MTLALECPADRRGSSGVDPGPAGCSAGQLLAWPWSLGHTRPTLNLNYSSRCGCCSEALSSPTIGCAVRASIVDRSLVHQMT